MKRSFPFVAISVILLVINSVTSFSPIQLSRISGTTDGLRTLSMTRLYAADQDESEATIVTEKPKETTWDRMTGPKLFKVRIMCVATMTRNDVCPPGSINSFLLSLSSPDRHELAGHSFCPSCSSPNFDRFANDPPWIRRYAATCSNLCPANGSHLHFKQEACYRRISELPSFRVL